MDKISCFTCKAVLKNETHSVSIKGTNKPIVLCKSCFTDFIEQKETLVRAKEKYNKKV